MTKEFNKFIENNIQMNILNVCSKYLERLKFAWEAMQESWGEDHPALKKVKEVHDKEVAACEAVKKEWREKRCMYCNSNNLQPSFAGDVGVTCYDCHRDDV